MQFDKKRMTLGSCAEAPPRAIRLVGWLKLVTFFVAFFFRVQQQLTEVRACFSLG